MLFKMSIIVLLITLCAYEWVGVPQCVCGGQRATYRRSCFSSCNRWISGMELKSTGLATSTFTSWAVSTLLTSVSNKQFNQLLCPLPYSSQMLLLDGRCVFHLPPCGTQGGYTTYCGRTKRPSPKVNPSIHLAFWSHLYIVDLSQSSWEGDQC